MFNMDTPCTFHIRKVSPSVLGCLLCPSQYYPTGSVFPIPGPPVKVSMTVADSQFETVVAFMGRPLPDKCG
jgi:hypothetical protein